MALLECGMGDMTCVEQDDGVSCVPTAPACAWVGTECAGDKLVNCRNEGDGSVRTELECGAIGQRCDAETLQCVVVDPRCGDGTSSACTENRTGIEACVFGEIVTIACAAVERTTCSDGRGGPPACE